MPKDRIEKLDAEGIAWKLRKRTTSRAIPMSTTLKNTLIMSSLTHWQGPAKEMIYWSISSSSGVHDNGIAGAHTYSLFICFLLVTFFKCIFNDGKGRLRNVINLPVASYYYPQSFAIHTKYILNILMQTSFDNNVMARL